MWHWRREGRGEGKRFHSPRGLRRMRPGQGYSSARRSSGQASPLRSSRIDSFLTVWLPLLAWLLHYAGASDAEPRTGPEPAPLQDPRARRPSKGRAPNEKSESSARGEPRVTVSSCRPSEEGRVGRCKHGHLPQIAKVACLPGSAMFADFAFFFFLVFQVHLSARSEDSALPSMSSAQSLLVASRCALRPWLGYGLRRLREVRSVWPALTITASGSTRLGGPAKRRKA